MTNVVKPVLIKAPRDGTVKSILDELNIDYANSHFAILVDGENSNLDTPVKRGQRVILLPAIGGGHKMPRDQIRS
ncbi:MAG: MoaD/ThiS family protein [Candidatus Ranarchaeia archaeon]